MLNRKYPQSNNLSQDEKSTKLLKDFLDSLMEFLHFAKMFEGEGKESYKDDFFYGQYIEAIQCLSSIIPLYNKVRNYLTKKPYSTNKIKLNFDNPQFLGGWDQNKEKDYSAVILAKDKNYYLGVMPKDYKKVFDAIPEIHSGEECYQKIIYKLLPGPNKMLPKVFFSNKGKEIFQPSNEILEIYKRETFKLGKDFSIEDCHKLIDFFKDSIENHPDWRKFNFAFSPTENYKTIAEFYKEVKEQGYRISFLNIPDGYIESMVNEGKLYLFQIYNKDFSKYSSGTPNLHTLYFREIFDPINLDDIKIALNGGAEMFYRPKSINLNDAVIHTAGESLKNKNRLNPNKESCFSYDLIKDKRYTENQFELHIPITLNFKSEGKTNINYEVRELIKQSAHNYVIGIDRGERNLIYISVIEESGRIVEQYSLNEIINEHNGIKYTTNYHQLLDDREKENTLSRREWKTIEGIKDLKEGYISQVVHKICELVEKYDAIIAMEDLNSGFKNSRTKVEKQVYQKFEKMLIDKLNYLADKKKEIDEIGSILYGYQLTNKFESFNKMKNQNGIIFYIPAWMTSKIDPSTGFVNLINTKYKSVYESKRFVEKLDDIRFNQKENVFEFDLDYDKFERGIQDYKKKWTICTNGSRINTFRNQDKNGEWDYESVILTEKMVKLLGAYQIDYLNQNIKNKILEIEEADFYKKFMHILSLTLQMRNSITGTDIDYLISPVKNKSGKFYFSDEYKNSNILPKDADANGAYNIARKALWIIEEIRKSEDLSKIRIAMKNSEWLKYAQTHI